MPCILNGKLYIEMIWLWWRRKTLDKICPGKMASWLTLWLNLANHKKVKHILLLFQNTEVTFLRGDVVALSTCASLM